VKVAFVRRLQANYVERTESFTVRRCLQERRLRCGVSLGNKPEQVNTPFRRDVFVVLHSLRGDGVTTTGKTQQSSHLVQ
jgi:hypothetical protein